MKGRNIPYSAEELAWIEERKEWPRAMLHRFFVMFFARDDVSLIHLNSLCKRRGWMTGRTGKIEKGGAPWNKGKPCEEGRGGKHPNARKTHFGKGHLPHNTKWLGHERVSKDGYVELSIAETNPHTGFGRRYVLKHRYLWEQANGPLAKGDCLKCLDGNKQNTDPANWELVPRALLPRLAGGNRYKRVLAYDDAAPEVRPSLLAIAKLEHRARVRDGSPKGQDRVAGLGSRQPDPQRGDAQNHQPSTHSFRQAER